ncbi:MAG TPA: hypothetical protein VFW23_08070 [Tepidisphaeraceae bacterium]|nr:hypothetical protein [Tepidisphaeraceae bacterium]
MKSIDKTNPDRRREDVSPVRSVELFLDFDPVGPEIPQEQSPVSAMGAEHQMQIHEAVTVITIVDFRRLKALICSSCDDS